MNIVFVIYIVACDEMMCVRCTYVLTQKGMTAVHHAVRNGHLSALKVLLEDCQCQLGLKAEVSVGPSSSHNWF